MIACMEESSVKRLRKSPMLFSKVSAIHVDYGQSYLQKILPHREPFLLIDQISKIDLVEHMIEVRSEILKSDPIFRGHFPEYPVYPGVLQIEMMGQAGLCLAYFVSLNTTEIAQNALPKKGLFTKIHHAQFLQGVFPNDEISVLAKLEEYDDFLGIVSCQIMKDDQICSMGVLEVYFDE